MSFLIAILSVVEYGPYTLRLISKNIFTKTPPILMMTMSFLLLIHVCMKSFGISITATSLSLSTSIIKFSRTYFVYTVVELESSLAIFFLCLFPPATVCPLILLSIYFLEENMGLQ